MLHKQLHVLLNEAVVTGCFLLSERPLRDKWVPCRSLSPTKRSTWGPYGRFRLRTFNCTCVAFIYCWHWGSHCFRYVCHLWFSLHSHAVPNMHDWLTSVELKKRRLAECSCCSFTHVVLRIVRLQKWMNKYINKYKWSLWPMPYISSLLKPYNSFAWG